MSNPIGDPQKIDCVRRVNQGVAAGESDRRVAGVAAEIRGQGMPEASSSSMSFSASSLEAWPDGDAKMRMEETGEASDEAMVLDDVPLVSATASSASPEISKEKIFKAVNEIGLALFRSRGLTEFESKGAKERGSVAIAPTCFFDVLGMALHAVPAVDQSRYLDTLKLTGMKSSSAIANALKAVLINAGDRGTIRIGRIFASNGAVPQGLQEYGAEVIRGERIDGGDLASKVNVSVSKMTNGKIPKLLNSPVVKVLASVFYLNLNWVKQFDPEDTTQLPFTLLDGSQITVPTMNRKFKPGEMREYYDLNYELFEFPYAVPDGRKLVKLILVPRGKANLLDLEKEFNPLEALSKLQPLVYPMRVSMPKTKTSWSKDNLIPFLEQMGLPCAGIKAQYDSLLMRVESETNEKGSEVAAAAAFITKGITPTIRINRAFASYIIDKEQGVILVAEDFVDENPFK